MQMVASQTEGTVVWFETFYQRITLAKNDRFVQDGGELTITKADIVKGFEAEMKQTLQKKGELMRSEK